jgi:hypothetical protein
MIRRFLMFISIIIALAWVGSTDAGVVDFESPPIKDLKPMTVLPDNAVPVESVITEQYQEQGVVFKGVAWVQLEQGQAASDGHGITGINSAGEMDLRSPIAFSFVEAGNALKPAVTDHVAVAVIPLGNNDVITLTLSAYGIDGKLLESVTYEGLENDSDGMNLEIRNSDGIHTVVIEQVHEGDGAVFDRLTFGDPVPAAISLTAMILPRSAQNWYERSSGETIPVAVLGQSTLNVLEIDPASCLFDGMGVKFEDGRYLEHIEDVNLDGYPDLVLQFDNYDSAFTANQETGPLTGNLFDGGPFEAVVELNQ